MNRFSLVSYNIDNSEEICVKDTSTEYLFSLSLLTLDSKDLLKIKVTDSGNDCKYTVKLTSKDFLTTKSMNIYSLYWLKLLLSVALSNFANQEEINKLYGYELKCEILILKGEHLKLLRNIDDVKNWDCQAIRSQQKDFATPNFSQISFERYANRNSTFHKIETSRIKVQRMSFQPRTDSKPLDNDEPVEVTEERSGLLLILSINSKKENMKFEIGIQIPRQKDLKLKGAKKAFLPSSSKSKKANLKAHSQLIHGINASSKYESFDDIKKKLESIREKANSLVTKH